MTLTLATARTQVRNYIDAAGTNDNRWSDAEINTAINIAIEQVSLLAASYGIDGLEQLGSATVSSTGSVDLSSLSILKLVSVNLISGSNYIPIRPTRQRVEHTNATGYSGYSVSVVYVPRTASVSSDSDSIQFVLNNPILDEYVVVLASSACKIKEGELNQGLEQRKLELGRQVSLLGRVRSKEITRPNRCAPLLGLSYTLTGSTLQLVLI